MTVPTFRYSDVDWANIYSLLPAAKPDNSASLRFVIEDGARLWRGTAPEIMKKRADTCGKILAALYLLEAAFEEADGDPLLEVRFPVIQDGLLSLRDDMKKWLSLARPPRRENKNRLRDVLLVFLIKAWESCGGEARAGMSGGDTPTGPLIRFLMTAAKPAGVQLTESSARAIIRKRQAELKQGGYGSLEAAYAALRATAPPGETFEKKLAWAKERYEAARTRGG